MVSRNKEFFDCFEPRRIQNPPQYASSKLVAPMLGLAVWQGMQATGPTLAVTGLSVANAILSSGVPIYYVSELFARAIHDTELPRDFMVEELKWPMAGLVFGFPSRFMLQEFSVDVPYVCCADLPIGANYPPARLLGTVRGTEIPRAKIGMLFSSWNDEAKDVSAFIGAYEKGDTITQAIYKYDYTDALQQSVDRQQFDEARLNKVVAFVFKLIIILSTRGDMIEQSVCTRKASAKHGKKLDALWSPTMIGTKYRPYYRQDARTGSHAPPKLHHRRAHIAWQFTGRAQDGFVSSSAMPRLLDGSIDWSQVDLATKDLFVRTHKRIWIERVLVGLVE